jgi:PKD repeat protein
MKTIKLQLIIVLISFCTIVNSQMSGTFNIGSTGDYTTIDAAIADLVVNEINGPVTLLLIDNLYSYGPAEGLYLFAIPGSSKVNTITIKPASTVECVIEFSTPEAACVNFQPGANNYIIDGSNNSTYGRNLTISGTATAGMDLVSMPQCESITIKNCILESNNNAVVGTEVKDIIIENNFIKQARIGIDIIGGESPFITPESIQIINNQFGSSSDIIQFMGIQIFHIMGCMISGNDITVSNSNGTNEVAGIRLNNVTRVEVSNNRIHDIISTETDMAFPISGIAIYPDTVSIQNNIISNNFIWHIAAPGGGSYNLAPSGIHIYSTNSTNYNQNTLKIFNNSIYLTPDPITGLDSDGAVAMGLFINVNSTSSFVDFRNNIVKSALGKRESSSANGITGYVIYNPNNYNPFSNIDYNQYYVANYQSSIFVQWYEGRFDNIYTWQAHINNEKNSIYADPKFVSDNDLHIQPGMALKGVKGLVNKDIDRQQRVYGQIGADEQVTSVIKEAQTITTNTMWNANHIKINGDITIANGATLTIASGTYVEFLGYYKIVVQGRIVAKGNTKDTIIFSVENPSGFFDQNTYYGGWAGIEFTNVNVLNDSSVFDYCLFEFAKGKGASYQEKQGGAISASGSSKIRVSNSVFRDNYVTGEYSGGGAIALVNNSNAIVIGNTFYKNQSLGNYYGGGGAIFVEGASPVIFLNKFFNNRTPLSSGGAIYIRSGSNPLISNNLMYSNFAIYGGAVLLATNVNGKFLNNTVTMNRADTAGGVCLYDNCNISFINNIIYYNAANDTGKQVYIFDNLSDPKMLFNNIEGGTAYFGRETGVTYSGTYSGNQNISPLFTDTLNRNFVLKKNSTCIDAGKIDFTSDSVGVNTDLKGSPRIFNSRVDIGAYEHSRISRSGTLTGIVTWDADTVFVTDNLIIQGTLTINPGVVVVVSDIIDAGHDVILTVNGELQVNGTLDKPIKFIPSGTSAWGGIYFASGASPNSELKNCIFKMGNGTPANNGTIYTDNINIKITNSSFYGGAEGTGSHIRLSNSISEISDCYFDLSENRGVVFENGDKSLVKNSKFEVPLNKSPNSPLVVNAASANIDNCWFVDNTESSLYLADITTTSNDTILIKDSRIDNIGLLYSYNHAGKMIVQNNKILNPQDLIYFRSVAGEITFANNEIYYPAYRNVSNQQIYQEVGDVTFINNTIFAGNTSAPFSYLMAGNEIFTNNIFSGFANVISKNGGVCLANYNTFDGATFNGDGDWNLNANPSFVNTEYGSQDLRLKNTSVCINVGDTKITSLMLGSNKDVAGLNRFSGRIDIGAHEFQGTGILPPGNALYFDGTNQCVYVPNSSSLDWSGSNNKTIMAWIRPYNNAAIIYSKINSGNGTLQLEFYYENGRLKVSYDSYNVEWGHAISDSIGIIKSWAHVAFTQNGHIIKFYFNGKLLSTHTLGETQYNATISAGLASIGGNSLLRGYREQDMDEVSIWNSALSDLQIETYYRSPLTGSEANLAAYYNFDKITGVMLPDATNNANDGWVQNINDFNWIDSRAIYPPTIDSIIYPSNTSFKAYWGSLPGVSSYRVLYLTDPCDKCVSDAIPIETTNNYYEFTGLPLGSSYRFMVASVMPNGQESWTDKRVYLPLDLPGNALLFNGTNQFDSVSNNPAMQFAGPYTLEAWVKFSNPNSSGYNVIMAKPTQDDMANNISNIALVLSKQADNKYYLFSSSGTRSLLDNSTPIELDKWTHVAVTYDGQIQRIYVNGKMVNSNDWGSKLFGLPSTTPFYIGCEFANTTNPDLLNRKFSGLMDEVKVWNVARSALEIKDDIHRVAKGNELGLVHYANFDRSDGIYLVDMTPNEHDGRLENMEPENWVASGAIIIPFINTIDNITHNGFRVIWDAIPDASKYMVDIATDDAFTNKVAGYNNLETTSTTLNVAGLSQLVKYYVRVKSLVKLKESDYSTGTASTLFNVTAGSDSPVCIGSVLNLLETTSVATSWSWTGPNGFSSTLRNPTIVNVTMAATGTYSVTAVNGGESKLSTVLVTINPSPIAPVTGLVQPDCSVSTGTINITSPKAAGMTYSIDGTTFNNTTGVFSGLTNSNYSVYAKNAMGCISETTSVAIAKAPLIPSTPITSLTQPTCAFSTGSISVSSPIEAGITYSIDGANYAASTSFTGLQPGTYPVTAKSTSGCVSAISNATINAVPANPAAPTLSVTQPKCAGDAGSIAVTAPTGLTYSLDGTNYSENAIFSNLNPGSYNVYAKNADGCRSTSQASISALKQLTLALAPTHIDRGVTGQIVATAGGGTGTYSYSIDGATSYQTSNIFNIIEAGIYNITVKDENGCTASSETTVNDNTPACNASFTFVVDATDPLKVGFADKSDWATDYYWDFGDGVSDNTATSSHTYTQTGKYEACLTVMDDLTGCMSSFCQDVEVAAAQEVIVAAEFSYTQDDKTVTFTDASENADLHYWFFGDGKFSNEVSPVHTYSKPGSYNVCLKVYNNSTGKTDQECENIVIGTPPCNITAGFNFLTSDKTVNFSSTSKGNIAMYSWNFDDGTSSSLAQPQHVFEKAGYYFVTLSVRNADGNCGDSYAEMIKVGRIECKANFEFSIDPSNFSATFANKSTGDLKDYFWLFDDKDYDLDKNPASHSFGKAGLHKVSLTVTDQTGSCTDYIEKDIQFGNIDCKAEFSYYIDSLNKTGYFYNKDEAGGNNTFWLFGDGGVSSEVNPVHTYRAPGYYNVGLTTYNPDLTLKCMDYTEKKVLVGNSQRDVEASFIYVIDPSTGAVHFKDNSSGNIKKWMWNFGDGTLSGEQNPSKEYNKSKYYNVCLAVTDASGNSNISCKEMKVGKEETRNAKAGFMYNIGANSTKVTFINSSSGNYQTTTWDFGDGTTSTDASPEHSYANAGYYLVMLEVKNTTSNYTDYKFDLINVSMPNVFKVMFGYVSRPYDKKAGGYPIDFIGAGLGDQARLKWSFSDDNSTDTTTNTPTHVFQDTGKYEVCLTYADPVTGDVDEHCEWVTTEKLCKSDTNKPTPSCKPITVTLVNGSIEIKASDIDNGSKDDCGKVTLEIDQKTFTMPNNYSVVLTVKDQNGNVAKCSNTVTVQKGTGISSAGDANITMLDMYPNPFKGKLTVSYTLKNDATVELSLTDLAGKQIVVIKRGPTSRGIHNDTYDANLLEAGTYILQLRTSSGERLQRVVVKN